MRQLKIDILVIKVIKVQRHQQFNISFRFISRLSKAMMITSKSLTPNSLTMIIVILLDRKVSRLEVHSSNDDHKVSTCMEDVVAELNMTFSMKMKVMHEEKNLSQPNHA